MICDSKDQMLCPLCNHIPYWLDKYFTVLYPKKISHRRGVGMGPNGKNLVFYWTCLGLLHFTNFSSALQITCQIPPTSSTQLHQKCKVGPNFNVFMKQQNRCFTNKYFELPHKFEDKLPTITTSYIKNILFYSFSHLAALLETRGKKCSPEPLPPESTTSSASRHRSCASSAMATHPVPRPPLASFDPFPHPRVLLLSLASAVALQEVHRPGGFRYTKVFPQAVCDVPLPNPAIWEGEGDPDMVAPLFGRFPMGRGWRILARWPRGVLRQAAWLLPWCYRRGFKEPTRRRRSKLRACTLCSCVPSICPGYIKLFAANRRTI
jgi:hypothetical protein